MRPVRLTLSLALALVLLGCATERPTRPEPSPIAASLPAWYPDADPVDYAGPLLPFSVLNDTTYVCTLNTAGLELEKYDLRVGYDLKMYYAAANSFIHDWSSDSEVAIQRKHPDVWFGLPYIRRNYALISDVHIRLRQVVNPQSGEIIVRSRDLSGNVTAQLLALNAGYKTIPLPPNCGLAAPAARNGALWVFQRAWDDAGEYKDSVCIYSLSGVRMDAQQCPYAVWSMEWSSKGLWFMHKSQPILFTLCDSALHVLGEFALPDFRDRFVSGIIIRNGEFWLYDRYRSWLFHIDDSASLATGQVVILDSVLPENPPGYSGTAGTADDRFLYIDTWAGGRAVTRAYNGLGHFVGEFAGISTGWDMTWDGEALWSVHNGHGGAYTNGLQLSRFVPL